MSDSLIHAAAGAAGGVVSMSLTYPLIVLSTRAAVETKKHRAKSTLDALKRILREEGVSGIYSGLTSSLLGIAVTNGVYYYYYEFTKSLILKARPASAKGLSALESMLAGLIAGSATTLISNPIWVIQTTQAVRPRPPAPSASASEKADAKEKKVLSEKPGIRETARAIMKQNGLLGFWRGVMPALVLVINPILQYTVFEQLKNSLVTRRTAALRARGSASAARITDMDFFWLGALSKLVATALTYPYIVLKSRLQSGHTAESKHTASLRALLHIVNEEGVGALYRGIGSKLVQSVLTAAILFAGQKRIYDLTKAALGRTA